MKHSFFGKRDEKENTMLSAGAIVGICIAGVCVAFILFLVLRAVFTTPKKMNIEEFTPEEIDPDTLAQHLSEAVQIPTVTVINEGQSYEPFLKYHEFLEKTYPTIHQYAEKTVINGYSLILKIDGSNPSLLPACFLSHQDVVPAPAEGWDTEPFGGEIKDGFVHGRGSLDMKGHMIALLEGLETILKRKEKPVRGIYLCFGHDEEITGKDGARNIVEYLYQNNIRFEYVIDEGGAIMDGGLLGVPGKIALIGTCEKGYVDYKLTSVKDGGHASSPKKRSSVDAIAQAVFDLSHLPMRSYWSKPIKETFKGLAPHMKFIYKLLFANADVLGPLLRLVLSKVNPITNSIVRTTFAFTQLQGAPAPNVIPREASAVVNVRINIGQTQQEVKEYIQKVVGKEITVTELNPGFDPTPVSSIEGEAYQLLLKSISEVFKGYIPAPYPFIAASDAKHYYKVCDRVYRFGPIEMCIDDQNRIHSNNERCNVQAATQGAQFFARLIENTCY